MDVICQRGVWRLIERAGRYGVILDAGSSVSICINYYTCDRLPMVNRGHASTYTNGSMLREHEKMPAKTNARRSQNW